MWWHFEESEEGVRKQSALELLRKVVPLFRPHAKYLYLGFGLLIFVTASQLIGPLILRYIIDKSIPAADTRSLLFAAVIYVCIAGLGAGFGYIQAITLFKLGINIITDLKSKLFEHVLHLGLDFHEKHSPGRLISRVESDTETLKELFGDVSVNLLRNVIFFIGILITLVVTDFGIAAWILLLVPLFFGATFWFIVKMKPLWREWRAQWAIVTGYVTEYVQGIDVIQQFNYQNRARARMKDVNLNKYRIEVPATFIEYGFWGGFMFGEIAAIIIVFIVGIPRAFAGTLTIGTLIMFIDFIRQMFLPIIQLSEQINFIQRSLISVERVFGILETERSIEDGPLKDEELLFEEEIRFENVWFAYEEDNWIIRDVSFSIRKGQKIALVGMSGGGKSTVVNLLLRFYDPQKGRITIDGSDIREFPVKAWREKLGLVLQDIFLFPGSVSDNLRVFDKTVPIEHIEKVAAIARADGIIGKLPGRYEGELAERGANLSVGERQLISFARALAFDPPLLVLDEATSSVDPHTERLVQEALDQLLEGRTAVIVAHRLSTIINADQILLIHNGIVEEQGKHDELLEENGLYAKLVRLQFEEAVGPLTNERISSTVPRLNPARGES
ncbi:ABC transporter ATP-binding protein [bacterium]|nr:ABC transporter ATP-binding protein [bacterium]